MAKKIRLTEMQKYGFTWHNNFSRAYQKEHRMDKKTLTYFIKNNDEYQASLYSSIGLNKRKEIN